MIKSLVHFVEDISRRTLCAEIGRQALILLELYDYTHHIHHIFILLSDGQQQGDRMEIFLRPICFILQNSSTAIVRNCIKSAHTSSSLLKKKKFMNSITFPTQIIHFF